MPPPPTPSASPLIVRGAAPIRICDNGGWTDTWFAGHGCVFNLAVSPCVEVEVRMTQRDDAPPPRHGALTIHAENFGPPYVRDARGDGWNRHPLIEAAIDAALDTLPFPSDTVCHVCIHCDAPPGASVGSSASTIVALLGALRYAAAIGDPRWLPSPPWGEGRVRGSRDDARTIAAAAHRVETERLGRQSGIQDQLAAACGGASFIEMEAYPHARVTTLPLDDEWRWELEARLSLIYLGRSHESSTIHDRVIAQLADRGPEAPPLDALRRAARAARDAFCARDVASLGRAFRENTDVQATLHPDLVSAAARRVIAIARAHGALGWKVNGAGGDGGSIAILGGASQAETRAMRRAVLAEDPSFQLVPVRISPNGLRVWEAR